MQDANNDTVLNSNDNLDILCLLLKIIPVEMEKDPLG